MLAWPKPERGVFFGAWGQQDSIGGHLATCSCITDVGREVIENIYKGMTRASAPKPPQESVSE